MAAQLEGGMARNTSNPVEPQRPDTRREAREGIRAIRERLKELRLEKEQLLARRNQYKAQLGRD